MKHIGYAVPYDKLNDTVTVDGAVNYFGFAECFSELVETNNVITEELDGKQAFKITEQGINVIDTLEDSLSKGTRRTALAAATRLTSFEKRGASVTHSAVELPDGRYKLSFVVKEHNEEIFSLSLNIETRNQLNTIRNNLDKNPDGVYKCIMAMLSGEADYLLDGSI